MNGLNVLLKARLCKGDLPGHEFHGNQWTDGSGSEQAFKDVGVLNRATALAGEVRTSLGFVGDTVARDVLGLANDNAPDWKFGLENEQLKTVNFKDVRALQPYVSQEKVKQYQQTPSERHPLALQRDGKYYIVNGTHRAEAIKANGKSSLTLRVVDIGDTKKLAKAAHPKTNVGKLLDAKTPKLQRKINAILSAAGQRVAKQAVKLLGGKLTKVSDEDQNLIQQILDALALEDISVDIVDSITPELIRAFKDAGIMGIAQLNLTPTDDMGTKINQRALDYMDEHGGELIKNLAGTTMDDMRSVLSDAIENGSSPGELADAIQELGSFSDSRAEMIARTELADAHVQGNLEGWRQTGIVEGKEWHAYDGCCDDCAELDGEIVGLDEDFPNDGGDGPPLHPRCECSILSVRNMDEADAEDNQGEEE